MSLSPKARSQLTTLFLGHFCGAPCSVHLITHLISGIHVAMICTRDNNTVVVVLTVCYGLYQKKIMFLFDLIVASHDNKVVE